MKLDSSKFSNSKKLELELLKLQLYKICQLCQCFLILL